MYRITERTDLGYSKQSFICPRCKKGFVLVRVIPMCPDCYYSMPRLTFLKKGTFRLALHISLATYMKEERQARYDWDV